jgi:hypothetical protein
MAKDHDVIIYMRFIKLDVVIPKSVVWKFMAEFGVAFSVDNSHGGRDIQSVDGYYDHPNGWHVKVSVWENDEQHFYEFLAKFCEEHDLKFRDPKQSEE